MTGDPTKREYWIPECGEDVEIIVTRPRGQFEFYADHRGEVRQGNIGFRIVTDCKTGITTVYNPQLMPL